MAEQLPPAQRATCGMRVITARAPGWLAPSNDGAAPPPVRSRSVIVNALGSDLKRKSGTGLEPGAGRRLRIAHLALADHAMQLGEQGGLADPAVVDHGRDPT
jgi:hypothetical protein